MKTFFHQLAKLPSRLFNRVVETTSTAVTAMVMFPHLLTQQFESYLERQGKAIRDGLKNTKEYDAYLATSAKQGTTRAVKKAEHSVVEREHALGHGFARLGRGIKDFVWQLGLDIRHGIHYSGEVAWSMVTSTLKSTKHAALVTFHPFISVGMVLLAPLRNILVRRAKEEALGEVSSTSDHWGHWEALILVLVSVVIGGLGALVVMTDPSSNFTLTSINPGRLFTDASAWTPQQLVVVGIVAMAFIFGTWFWLSMLRDCWTREFPTNVERTKWKLATSLLFIPGAVIYFLKVYNHWSVRQFVGYHFVSVLATAVAVLVMSSSYGTLWYFNQKAEANVRANGTYTLPNLELPTATKNALLGQSSYGAPLTPSAGGKVDPFAPVAGSETLASPQPSVSPSPASTPLIP